MTLLSEYFVKMDGILPNLDKVESTAFTEGFSNHVYLISWDKMPRLVLRIPSIDCEAFYICRDSELSSLQNAAVIGLSPPICWHDEKGGVACQYVSQPSLDWAVCHTKKSIKQMAQALRQAHSLPLVHKSFFIFEVIQHYLDGIQMRLFGHADIKKEWQYLVDIFQTLTLPQPLLPFVLCHNDINPKNVLMDEGKLWLIDWEYVGVGDPLFDLAVVVRSHNLDEQQAIQLLTFYDVNLPLKESLEVLGVYSKAYGLREMAWLLLKHLVTPEDSLSLAYYYEFKATPKLNPFLVNKER